MTQGLEDVAGLLELAVEAEDEETFNEAVAELDGLEEKLAGNSHVQDIRGQGLMIGIELDQNCAELVNRAREKGLLINVTAGNTVRLLPPLVIDQQQAEQITGTVSDLILTLDANDK